LSPCPRQFTLAMKLISRWAQKLQSLLDTSDRASGTAVRRIVSNQPNACVPNTCSNGVSTRRYNWVTFFPLSLLYQFRLASNCYFLFLVVLVLIPGIAPVTPFSTIFPLMFVLSVSEVREFVEEYQAAKRDKRTNLQPVNLLKGKRIAREEVKPGDIVLLKRDERVPADILILQSASSDGSVYIETASLDGETNLKVRKCPNLVRNMTLGSLTTAELHVTCEEPHVEMYAFGGSIKDMRSGEREDLCLSNIVWRGCTVRNTEWTAGLVVYSGADCKVMLNTRSGLNRPSKVTGIVRQMNGVVLWICILQVVVCIVYASVGSSLFSSSAACWYLLGSGKQSWFPLFFAYFVLLSNLIPVSLWVCMELLKVAQAVMIEKDCLAGIKCNSKNIHEELGQITHVFSDKTGTLTMNKMKFVGLSVSGKLYHLPDEEEEEMDKRKTRAWEEGGKLVFPGVIPPNPDLIASVSESCKIENSNEFKLFECLSVCHSCERVVEPITGQLSNHASSPDEAALVSAAADCGCSFSSRPSANSIAIDVFFKKKIDTFDILHQIAFSSERRMMSVVIQRRADKSVCVMTKGADSSVFPLCVAGPVEETKKAVATFSYYGYRTLCVAVREIASVEEWERIKNNDELIESGLTLIGSTAVEDRLQEQVPSTLRALKAAGIKVCMITGDKRETAINIARSCGLISSRKNVYVMLSGGCSQADGQLADEAASHSVGGGAFVPLNYLESLAKTCWPKEYWQTEIANLGLVVGGGMTRNVSRETTGSGVVGSKNKFSLVLDGKGLQSIFASPSSTQQLVDVLSFEQCEAVVFCRVSPKQKGEIVKTVQNHLGSEKSTILAVGDGANDVPMINLANVGVGISGNEGSQAANSADYALSKFSDLYRLVFVHGRWNYRRTSKFLSLFLHKNFSFALVQFWFATVSAFSARTVYESSYMLLFNSIFGIVPLFLFGALDKDLDPDMDAPPNLWQPPSVTLAYWKEIVVPKLYLRAEKFSAKHVFKWFLLAICHSVIGFYFVWASWDFDTAAITPSGQTPSLMMASILVYTFEIFLLSAVTLYASASWTLILLLSIAICNIGAYFLFVFVYDLIFIPSYSWPVYQLAADTMGNMQFWAILVLSVSTAMLPLLWLSKSGTKKLTFANTIRQVKANAASSKIAHSSHCPITQL